MKRIYTLKPGGFVCFDPDVQLLPLAPATLTGSDTCSCPPWRMMSEEMAPSSWSSVIDRKLSDDWSQGAPPPPVSDGGQNMSINPAAAGPVSCRKVLPDKKWSAAAGARPACQSREEPLF